MLIAILQTRKILKEFGYSHQLRIKLIEELDELKHAIFENDSKHILEEIVDCSILFTQIVLKLGVVSWCSIYKSKTKRTISRIKSGFYKGDNEMSLRVNFAVESQGKKFLTENVFELTSSQASSLVDYIMQLFKTKFKTEDASIRWHLSDDPEPKNIITLDKFNPKQIVFIEQEAKNG